MFPPLLTVYMLLLFAALSLPSTAHPAASTKSAALSIPSTDISAWLSVNVKHNETNQSPSHGNPGTLFDVAQNKNVATDATCGFWNPTDIEDVKWCLDHLRKKGRRMCIVPGYGHSSQFCSRNDAYIHGIGVNPDEPGPIMSYCNDVALALDWIVNNCARTGWSDDGFRKWVVAGSAPANGNGGLLVVAKAPDGPGVPSKRRLPDVSAIEAKDSTLSKMDNSASSESDHDPPSSVDVTSPNIKDVFNSKEPRSTAADPVCGGYNPAPIEDVQWCQDYMHSIGMRRCVVPGYQKSTLFCQHGAVAVHGLGMNPDEPDHTESSCQDVALAIDYLRDHCTDWVQLGGKTMYFTAGTAPARGNGGLGVIVKTPFGPGIPGVSDHLSTEQTSSPANISGFAQVTKRNVAIDPRCGLWQSAHTRDVKWCSDFLHKKGSDSCTVPGYGKIILFCSRNNAFVHGMGLNPDEPELTASSCEDVAQAIDYLIDHCSNTVFLENRWPETYTVGYAPARGNGGLAVVVKDKYGPGLVPGPLLSSGVGGDI